jgi:hypothetical protein
MSEFQYYEFISIDKVLSKDTQKELSDLSSRAKVTSRSAKFVYSYGSFRGNEESLMFAHFDAFLYWANWGTRKIVFRFPKDLIDKKALIPFTFSNCIEIKSNATHILLIIEENWEGEAFSNWFDSESTVSENMLINIRNAIMEGDYRALYLVWLHFHAPTYRENCYMDFEDYYEDEEDEEGENQGKSWEERVREPFLPNGLQQLEEALQEFIAFFEMDKNWITAAARDSKPLEKNELDVLAKIKALSENEKNDFLLRLAQNEPNLATLFLKKLTGTNKQNPIFANHNATVRTIAQIRKIAEIQV